MTRKYKNIKQPDPATFTNKTLFREAERKYKKRKEHLDATSLINFSSLDQNSPSNRARIQLVGFVRFNNEYYDQNIDHPVYELDGFRGFLYVPNPFKDSTQAMLSFESLSLYSEPPNISNLDTHWNIPQEGIWKACKSNSIITKKENVPNPYASESYLDDKDVKTEELCFATKLLKKLRWITLGRQFDWFLKQYKDEVEQIPIPSKLCDIGICAIEALGSFIYFRPGAKGAGADMEGDEPSKYCERRKGACSTISELSSSFSINSIPLAKGYFKPFTPQAGIINYYQTRDSLTAHVDRSEVNMEAPLFSTSFGHSCVFLLGGSDRDQEPIAINMQSGDIIILSGDARRAFHGVPRILEGTLPPIFKNCDLLPYNTSQQDKQIWLDFMATSRINVNLRQVF